MNDIIFEIKNQITTAVSKAVSATGKRLNASDDAINAALNVEIETEIPKEKTSIPFIRVWKRLYCLPSISSFSTRP